MKEILDYHLSASVTKHSLKFLQTAEQLLLAMKMGEAYHELSEKLASAPLNQLKKELDNDQAKKAFWINVYNAYFLILRKELNIAKPQIFKNKLVTIASESLSLDDIEHGILRKYRWKFSLGYLPNIFSSSLIKSLAVNKIDYRIHFALNCGAESCPPIAFYHHDKIDKQLDMGTMSFLESETKKNEAKKTIYISQLFKWFKADFGGNKGIRKILQEKIQMETDGYALAYSPYSWDENLENWS